jgi:hypothetical protein
MASPISRLVPTAVVVAAASYCAWPYIFPSSEAGAAVPAMPEIAVSQLSPTILPPPQRDPFQLTVEKGASPVRGAAAASTSRSGSTARGKPAAPADPLEGLALLATSILAEQRLAVINGRIYAERDALTSKDPSATPCIVAQILPDRVLLQCAGRTETLHYANSAAPAKGTNPKEYLPSAAGTRHVQP